MPAALIPELYVRTLDVSLKFYAALGFTVSYDRPEESFAMLERDGAAIMIEQPTGRTFLTGPIAEQRGSGISLQITVADADALWASLPPDCRIVLPIETHRYQAGSADIRVRQFVVADPDGYVLRFSERIA